MSTIKITDRLAEELTSHLASGSQDKIFILTDTNTHTQCLPLLQHIPALAHAKELVIHAGDTNKTLEQLSAVWQFLSDNGATRHSLLINVGGGMITDLGGFAGATFKRGIRTINIPTTLMASVDASIGGKTGVNFNGLKNEIGAFHFPDAILIDCMFLKTLDRQNILSGYAEMLKHSLLDAKADGSFAAILSFNPDAIEYSELNQMVARSIAVKACIVEEDPMEKGIRKALNLGHTIGHAIESLSFQSPNPLLHGHAVAIGLICELYLSHRLCGFPIEKLRSIAAYIKEYYAPFPLACKHYDALYDLMRHDKKNESDAINFTLIANIGDIRINQIADRRLIELSLDFYQDFFGL
ncbi:MAG: 3-dehydroquinate synthase [Tannerellaceae bacterium]|jgi:3-dehydroquinate synthase|nr:3-dehydroquinate synthase [Tannerellaceae bacterium]